MKNLILSIILLLGSSTLTLGQITGGNNSNELTPQTGNASQIAPVAQVGVNEANGTLGNSYSLGTVTCPNGLSWTQNLSYSASLKGGDTYPYLDGIPYGEGWNLSLPSVSMKYYIKQQYSDDEKRILFEDFESSAPTNSFEFGFDMTKAEATSDGEAVGYYPEITIPGKGSFLLTHKMDQTYIPIRFDEYFEISYNSSDNEWTAKFASGMVYVFSEVYYSTVNPTDLRHAPEDIESQADLHNSVAPRYLPSKWFISEIYSVTGEDIPYKILFEYKRLGNINRHKSVDYQLHQSSTTSNTYCNQEVSYSDVETDFLSSDILLKTVSAVFYSRDKIKSENDIITLEKLEFNYGEDETLHKPGILNTNFTDGGRTVEAFDEMYYRSVIYTAKQYNSTTQQYELNNFRRYHHRYQSDPTEDITKSSVNNPYLYDGNYRRSEASGIDGIGFDHCFLETDRISFSANPLDLNYMPIGDQYEISVGLEAANSAYNYCTFDINIMGSKEQDLGPTSNPEDYLLQDYNDARSKRVFSTFNTMGKWNIFSFANTTRTSLQTSNFFTLNSGLDDLNGMFIQVGPGAADMDYARPLLGSSSTLDIAKNVFTFGDRIGKVNYWLWPHWANSGYSLYNQTICERVNHPVSQNFGIGYPFFNILQVAEPLYAPNSSCYNNTDQWSGSSYGSIFKPLSSIGSIYTSSSGHTIDPYRFPTLSKGISLTDIKVYRYSKTTYVLKNVKHWVGYSLNDALCDGQDFELKAEHTFDYQTASLDVKEHRFYESSELPANSSSIPTAGTRYVVLLKRINQKEINQENYITTSYDYQSLEKVQSSAQALTVTGTTSAGDITLHYYNNYGKGFALNRVTNTLGLITNILYSSDYTTFSYTENNFRDYYYKDKGKVITQLKFLYDEIPPSFGATYIPKVYETVVGDEKGGQLISSYTYGPTYAKELPWVPGRTTIDKSDMNEKPLSGKSEMYESWGVSYSEVTVSYLAQGAGSPTYYGKTKYEYFDDTEWPKTGKLKKKQEFGKSDLNNPEVITEYDYTDIKAFENFTKRMIFPTLPFYPNAFAPLPNYWALPVLTYDYADIHNGTLDINSVGATSAMNSAWDNEISTGYFTTYKVTPSTFKNLVQFTEYGNGFGDYATNGIICEADKDEVVLIYNNHNWLLDIYFVRPKKVTTTIFKDNKSITKIKEFDYFAANSEGEAVGEGWKYVMEHLDGQSGPIDLYFEPSWQLYSVTEYSPQMPDVKNRTEYFYYYDLKNRYGAFAPEILSNASLFQRVKESISQTKISTFKGCLPFVNNGLEGLAYASMYNIRTGIYEQRSGIINPTQAQAPGKFHSDYTLWGKFNKSLETTAESETDINQFCTTPPPPPAPVISAECYKLYYNLTDVVNPYFGSEVEPEELEETSASGWFNDPTLGRIKRRIWVKKTCAHFYKTTFNGKSYWNFPSPVKGDPLKQGVRINEIIKDPINVWSGGGTNDIGYFLQNQIYDIILEPGGLLSQYLLRNADSIKTRVFDNYDPNNPKHVEVGNFTLDALTTISDYIDFYSIEFNNFRSTRTPTELVQIVFQGATFSPESGAISSIPIPVYNEINTIIVEEPCASGKMTFTNNYPSYYNVHLSSSQIEESVLPNYASNFSYYNVSSFPPILKWDMLPDLSVNCFENPGLPSSSFTSYDDFYYFQEDFPYDTINRSIVHEYNMHDQVSSVEDERGLYHNSENYKLSFKYYRASDNGPIRKTVLNMANFGLLKATFANDGVNDLRQKDYVYTHTNLLQTVNSRKGIGYTAPSNYVTSTYDGFNRVIDVTNNEGLIAEYEYSNWNTRDIYTGGYSTKHEWDDFNQRMLSNYFNSSDYFSYSDKVLNRTYLDPMGRQTLSVTQGYQNYSFANWVQKAGYTEFDDLGAPSKQFKPIEVTGVPPNYLNFGTTSSLNSGLYTTQIRDYKVLPSQTEFVPFGRTAGNHTQISTSSLIDHNQFQIETGASSTLMNSLFPNYASTTYIISRETTTNENGEETVTYTDAAGRNIASLSSPDGATPLLTTSVYNDYGRVSKVTNPKNQSIYYEYNHLGQMIVEFHPDKGWTKMMYDRSGNIVLYQDANLSSPGSLSSYRQMKYDLFGRLKKSSLRSINMPYGLNCANPETCNNLAPLGYMEVDYQTYSLENFHMYFNSLASYSWRYRAQYASTPDNYYYLDDFLGYEILEKELYYDFIPSVNSSNGTEEFVNVHTYLLESLGGSMRALEDIKYRSNQNYNLDKLSAAKIYDQYGNLIMYKFFGYDLMGRMTDEVQQFNPNGIGYSAGLTGKGRIYRIQNSNFDLKGRPKETSLYYQKTDAHNQELSRRKSYSYDYDELGRVKTMYWNTFVDNSLLKSEKMVEYTYDKATGLMTDKKFFAQYQSGCEKEIDHIQLDVLTDAQNRLSSIQSKFFNWRLYYDAQQLSTDSYIGSLGLAGTLPGNSQNYNGRINASMAEYAFTANASVIGNLSDLNGEFEYPTLAGYQYDEISRLTEVNSNLYDYGTSRPLLGDEAFVYDPVGNFISINRYKAWDIGSSNYIQDQFEFNYLPGSNILTHINEIGNPGNILRSYTYDPNGNVLSDDYRGITNTQYYLMNRPFSIQVNGLTENYLYNETGTRMYKKSTGTGHLKEEFYLIGSSGMMYSIEEPAFDNQGNGNSTISRYMIPDIGYQDNTDDIHYSINDHLGNLRLSYTVDWCNTCGSQCIDQHVEYQIEYIAEYLAFGGILREFIRPTTEQEKFLTTGNERDKLTGWDYRNARYYDADLGRFLGVDPLTHKAFEWSPFNGLWNNPILNIDPQGTWAGDYYNGDGSYLGSDGINDDKTYVIYYVDDATAAKGLSANELIELRDAEHVGSTQPTVYELPIKHSEFQAISGTLYGEGSSTYEEAAGIYSVMRNRSKASGKSIYKIAGGGGIYGWSKRDKINDPTANKQWVRNARRAVIEGVRGNKDYSGGAYYWHGKDFGLSDWKAYKDFYEVGFLFTNPVHDLWNLGNKLSGNSNWNYKYESTGAQGNTTFMKLTNEWIKANNHKGKW